MKYHMKYQEHHLLIMGVRPIVFCIFPLCRICCLRPKHRASLYWLSLSYFLHSSAWIETGRRAAIPLVFIQFWSWRIMKITNFQYWVMEPAWVIRPIYKQLRGRHQEMEQLLNIIYLLDKFNMQIINRYGQIV